MCAFDKKKNNIAVCCATLRELSVMEPMDAICLEANRRGMGVQIYQAFEEMEVEDDLSRGEKSVFDLVDYESICGLIIFSERLKDQQLIGQLIENAKKYDIPVVSFDQKKEGCYGITFGYADAFEEIVRHLVEFHHFKEFFVMAGMRNNSFSDERLMKVRRVLAEHDITLPDENVAYGDFWEVPAKKAMETFFEEGRKMPEAFIAFNDAMATVVIDEVQKRGYCVPDDVVVTGFDGIFLAENYVPKITTAKQQYDVAGCKAVEMIAEYNEGKREIYDEVVPFKTQISQSCGCHDVDVTGVTGKIRGLYADFSTCKRFSGYMDQMSRNMMARSNMSGMAEGIRSFGWSVDNHEQIFFCLNKSYLREDDNYFKKVSEEIGFSSKDREKDAVLLLHLDHGQEQPQDLNDFEAKHILPNMEKWQAAIKNVLITSLHIGYDVYGHMVMDYIIGNRETYKTRMFVNRIGDILLINKQRSLLNSSHLELVRTKNRLEEMYVLDPMTGIYNRRGFYQKYAEELRKDKKGYVTIISVDLDRLKPINDNYGHQEGDFAIRSLGESLSQLVGIDGICARFGGDEFVAMLYSESKDEKIGEHIWQDMTEILTRKKDANEKPYKLQCSVGAVQEPWTPEADIDAMIRQSDKLLYEMKRLHHEQEKL